MNSVVYVKVGKRTKKTKVRYRTNSPYYNETTLQELKDKSIKLTVYRPRTACCGKKILGYTIMDVATVWEQPDHQFFHKWAVLNSPKSGGAGTRGYLKVIISILSKGQTPKTPIINPLNEDEIEGNLLLPQGVTLERHRALFTFHIHKGFDIKKKTIGLPVLNEEYVKNKKHKKEYPNVSVHVTFAGLTAKTKVKKRTTNPIWNQSLTIAEMYPTLCQKIKLELCYKLHLRKTIKCVKYILLSSIASDKEDGFLPTFGPSFIHFYRKTPIGEEYAGKVLISLKTSIFSDIHSKSHCVTSDSIPPLIESSLWNYEDVLMFLSIVDVSAMQKYLAPPISFELNFGRIKATKSADDEKRLILPKFLTEDYYPNSKNKNYLYIEFKTFPCLYLKTPYPNLQTRLYISNMIGKIVDNMNGRLSELEYMLNKKHADSDLIGTKLMEYFDYVASAARIFIDTMKHSTEVYVTNLDTEKKKMCLREMADIEDLCQNLYNPRSKKNSFYRAQDLYERMQILEDYPQETWPDVLLWLKSENIKIACIRLHAKDLVFCETNEQKGKYCGKVSTFYFNKKNVKKTKSPIICKIDLYLWLGLYRHIDDCLSFIPKGYKYKSQETELPDYLEVAEKKIFQCRVHLYQGRFIMAFDHTGLSDFFVTVIVGEKSQKTRVKKNSRVPTWNETLIFRNIVAYGNEEEILLKPPNIFVEIKDLDKCYQFEHVGNCTLMPTIKFKGEVYGPPKFPPKLSWHNIENQSNIVGDILAASELLEVSDNVEESDLIPENTFMTIPEDIRPGSIDYRMEIMFWGIRLKRGQNPLDKLKILIECGEVKLWSSRLTRHRNFLEPIKHIDFKLPNYDEFLPALSIKLLDSNALGRTSHIANNLTRIQKYIYLPMIKADWDKKIAGIGVISNDSLKSHQDSYYQIEPDPKIPNHLKKKTSKYARVCCLGRCIICCLKCCLSLRKKKNVKKKKFNDVEEFNEEDNIDWWTKYYSSLEGNVDSINMLRNKNFKLKIYDDELENQKEFSYLSDTLDKINLYRGKVTGDAIDDESLSVGLLKYKIAVYAWPPPDNLHYVTPSGYMLEKGYFQGQPSNDTQDFIVRVYCIRGMNLPPMDVDGKCDPYIHIKMHDVVVDDAKHHLARKVNPTFGRCFELRGSFPIHHSLTVSIWDWDRVTRRDLIGETTIDLESRLYTKHRAHCGLQYEYKEDGPCPWRDQMKPTEILEKLCLYGSLPVPEYIGKSVVIGSKQFFLSPEEILQESSNIEEKINQDSLEKEMIALKALHNWQDVPVVGCHLIPEHVETRSLYNPSKPGIEQGKIQLWIDIFPANDAPVPDIVNITPRKPVSYELRVTIWDTEDVILCEDDFFGDRKTDIYVKGWLSRPEHIQQTDVHYRSLNGEGNFNWRFVFPFEYISTEQRVIIRKKERVIDIDETEYKVPCKIILQVWDNDIFSPDDYLGTLNMDLNRMPRGAKMPKKCTLKIMQPEAPKFSIFKVRRTRGWWPFSAFDKKTHKMELRGKVDAEFELLTAEEAEARPAGLGRSEPDPLPFPKRPETSFAWFANPLKTCRFIVWKNIKYKLLFCVILALFLLFAGLAIYSFPGYFVKKLLHA